MIGSPAGRTRRYGGGPVLAVDARRLFGRRAGVARYLHALLREWSSAELPFARVILLVPGPVPPDALPAAHPFDTRIVPGIEGPAYHWAPVRAASDADVLFCPSYVSPLLWRRRAVVTTHDTLHELLPGTFPWRTRYRPWLYRHCARRADAVLTDSEASRAQVVRLYGIPPAQVHAVPLAADAAFAFADPAAPPVRLRHRLGDGPLVLFVGGFARRRNLPALVRAFARCRGLLPPDSRLVLAGDNPLGVPIADIAQRAGAGGAVHVLGHVPDDELRALYQAASVFVYPSDHEGFGLPVLEAMAAGTPVITLDNSSLGEVVGGAGMLLPRADEELLADAMRRMLCDGRLRGACAEQGRRRAAMFSWVRTARQTMDVLAGVADSR